MTIKKFYIDIPSTVGMGLEILLKKQNAPVTGDSELWLKLLRLYTIHGVNDHSVFNDATFRFSRRFDFDTVLLIKQVNKIRPSSFPRN